MVSVCLLSDALSQHLPFYFAFSHLGRGVSLHSCSSKVQPLLLTLDVRRYPSLAQTGGCKAATSGTRAPPAAHWGNDSVGPKSPLTQRRSWGWAFTSPLADARGPGGTRGPARGLHAPQPGAKAGSPSLGPHGQRLTGTSTPFLPASSHSQQAMAVSMPCSLNICRGPQHRWWRSCGSQSATEGTPVRGPSGQARDPCPAPRAAAAPGPAPLLLMSMAVSLNMACVYC